MTIDTMIVTIFILIIPLRFRLIWIKMESHQKDNSSSLDKILQDNLNGFDKWGVLTLGLIVGIGRSTLNEDIIVRLGLVVGVRLGVE